MLSSKADFCQLQNLTIRSNLTDARILHQVTKKPRISRGFFEFIFLVLYWLGSTGVSFGATVCM